MTGFKSKRMAVITGRGGKSTWAQMVQDLIPPDITLLTSAPVDGKPWYTVKLTMPAGEWLRQQPQSEWHEHIDQRGYIGGRLFDVSGQLYTALLLKWK